VCEEVEFGDRDEDTSGFKDFLPEILNKSDFISGELVARYYPGKRDNVFYEQRQVGKLLSNFRKYVQEFAEKLGLRRCRSFLEPEMDGDSVLAFH